MELFNNHKKLFGSSLLLFLGLTTVVAIVPAINNQNNNAPLPSATELSAEALKGKEIFIAEGCVACHTQQVRNVDMDKTWGDRPSIAADYASNTRISVWSNTATLMGTERTGPDLTNVGNRQPLEAWHLVHLYQPRAVVGQSVMPAYPWLFEVKKETTPTDVEITVPDEYRKGITGKIVATKQALHLVAYLKTLKQTPLPNGTVPPDFLYKREEKTTPSENESTLPDGKTLYAAHCQNCHQANGEGLKGAFPPLKGSAIANGTDLELYVTIIMKGYDARPEYAVMPAVGTNNNLTPEQVTAIINYEKSSWGNHAQAVKVEEVKKIIEFIKTTAKNN